MKISILRLLLRKPLRAFSLFYGCVLGLLYVNQQNTRVPICILSLSTLLKIEKRRNAKIIINGQLIIDKRNCENTKSPVIFELAEDATLIINGIVKLHPGTVFTVKRGATLIIGSDENKEVEMQHNVQIIVAQKIAINSGCILSWNIYITDSTIHAIGNPPRLEIEPVLIEENVWISANAKIMKGVQIGAHSVVGIDSLVTKSVPPNCLVAGIPAKTIKNNITWAI